ncbi:hypothetical protein BD310DRAFT_75941 [Dichomitus squalens]|uniref:Uncharacterized protein n=1 Tax=Dichomitus squalens TaxID=114155 RepID=A0A4Q9PJY6_9APHY|nr:hypothetical protein BD310DRAFT_75941 [Dichomitus squalens]
MEVCEAARTCHPPTERPLDSSIAHLLTPSPCSDRAADGLQVARSVGATEPVQCDQRASPSRSSTAQRAAPHPGHLHAVSSSGKFPPMYARTSFAVHSRLIHGANARTSPARASPRHHTAFSHPVSPSSEPPTRTSARGRRSGAILCRASGPCDAHATRTDHPLHSRQYAPLRRIRVGMKMAKLHLSDVHVLASP